MQYKKVVMGLLVMMLCFSRAGLATEGEAMFPVDFGSKYVGDEATMFVSVAGSIMALSVKHADDTDEAYVLDVNASTLVNPQGDVLSHGSEEFTPGMDRVIEILSDMKDGNSEDAQKLEGTIDYLQSWR